MIYDYLVELIGTPSSVQQENLMYIFSFAVIMGVIYMVLRFIFELFRG